MSRLTRLGRGAKGICLSTVFVVACSEAPPQTIKTPVVAPLAEVPLSCQEGRADCDSDRKNECETDIHFEDKTCGSCDTPCGAEERCVFGMCRRTGLLAVSHGHSCVARGGEAHCWGNVSQGQLGDGSSTSTVIRTGAVRARDLLDVVGVTTGGYWLYGASSCALRRNGEVWCWGSGASPTPKKEPGWEGATDISVGDGRLCAILSGGSLKCSDLQGKREQREATLSNIGGVRDAVQVCTSYGRTPSKDTVHSCALRKNGSVVCWGSKEAAKSWSNIEPLHGDLVFGEIADLSDAVQLSCGGGHDCALRSNGGFVCWGDDGYGQLGTAIAKDQKADKSKKRMTDYVEIAAGAEHTCGLLRNGSVWCWGSGYDGRLGNGSDSSSDVPVQVAGLERAAHIGAGERFSCAQQASGSVACWGEREGLGDGRTAGPHKIPGITTARSVRAEIGSLCILEDKGAARCLHRATGETPPPHPKDGPTFSDVVAIPVQDGVGESFCVVHKSGRVECWDGFGITEDSFYFEGIGPARSALVGQPTAKTGFVLLANGGVSVFGLAKRAWGITGPLRIKAVPVKALSKVKELAGSSEMACALTGASQIVCLTIAPVEEDGVKVVATHKLDIQDAIGLSGSSPSFTVLHKNGTVSQFYLGTDGRPSPITKVDGLSDVAEVSQGHLFACARHTNGEVTCWGAAFSGELGAGDFVVRDDLVKVKDLKDAVSIDAAQDAACAAKKDGTVVCWGNDVTEPDKMAYPVPVVLDTGPLAPEP